MVGGGCYRVIRSAKLQTITVPVETKRYFKVFPDQIQLNGNHLRMVNRADDGRNYLISATLSDRQDLRQLMDTKHPLFVAIEGHAESIQPATNENQFNSQRFYYAQGVFNCLRGNCSVKGSITPQGIDYLHCWRLWLMNYFKTMPAPLSLYCNRLLLGISDEGLEKTIRQVQVLGIIHLFCLSGLHVAVLCRIIRSLLSAINLPREWINYCQMVLLPVYWIIGGGSVSLTRAVLMMEFGLFTKAFSRLRGLNGWSITLMLHLIFSPSLAMNFGGQLSYLLSFSLSRIKWHNRLRQTAGLTIISLPVVVNTTYQIHLLTMVINWLMIPIFSFIVLPTLLICALCGWLFPELVYFCNNGLMLFQHLIQWLADLPGEVVIGKIGNPLSAVLVVMSLLTADSFKHQKLLRIIILLTYVFIFCWHRFPVQGEVTFFDIGQGDSILIQTPFNRQVIMIDTGGRPQYHRKNIQNSHSSINDAQRISINYLKSKGINQIDAIFLSHRDTDHIGYLESICQELKVQLILVPSGMENLSCFKRKVPANVKVLPVTDQCDLTNLKLKVLHPFHSGNGRNEDSMVLYGIFGGKSFIFSGDLDRAGERQVIKYYPQLKADIVKLGHHGSKTSSDPHYLRQLHPQLAIISAGRHNRYGHPHHETISTLKQQQISFWSTQKYGMIKYRYSHDSGKFQTTLKGDEFAWIQSTSKNN